MSRLSWKCGSTIALVTALSMTVLTACSDDAANPVELEDGMLRIVTVTTGDVGLAGDGYIVSVEGVGGFPVAPNGVLDVAELEPGSYRATLSELGECEVDGENPAEATVPPGGVAELTFEVSC